MKNFTKLFALAVVILGFSATSFGQTGSATATAISNVAAALDITNNANMDFGVVYKNGTGGTVVVTPSATPTNIGTDVVTGGTPIAAKFTVTGDPLHTFKVTIPLTTTAVSTATGTKPIGAADITVDGWSCNFPVTAGVATGVSLASGTTEVYIGATLHVGANQLVGNYITAPFTVTVDQE